MATFDLEADDDSPQLTGEIPAVPFFTPPIPDDTSANSGPQLPATTTPGGNNPLFVTALRSMTLPDPDLFVAASAPASNPEGDASSTDAPLMGELRATLGAFTIPAAVSVGSEGQPPVASTMADFLAEVQPTPLLDQLAAATLLPRLPVPGVGPNYMRGIGPVLQLQHGR